MANVETAKAEVDKLLTNAEEVKLDAGKLPFEDRRYHEPSQGVITA